MSSIDRTWSATRARISSIEPEHAKKLIDDGAFLVDTRPAAQRSAFGTIPGAVAIERTVLEWRLDPSSPAPPPPGAVRGADRRVLSGGLLLGAGRRLARAARAASGARPRRRLRGVDGGGSSGDECRRARRPQRRVRVSLRAGDAVAATHPPARGHRRAWTAAWTSSPCSACAKARLTSSETRVASSPSTRSARSPCRSGCSAPRRSSSSITPTAAPTASTTRVWVDAIAAEVGVRPDWAPGGFGDIDDDVRRSDGHVCARARFSRTPTAFAASSTTSPPASSAKSPSPDVRSASRRE